MYSFNQRPDTLVMNDPFYGIWLKSTGKKQPFYDEVMLRMECDDASKIHDQIEDNEREKGHVFVRNTINTVPHMNEDRLLKYRHVLLIQDPADTIDAHGITEPALTVKDLQLEDQLRIHDWLKARTGEDPIVIDSKELKRDAASVLIKVCKRLGLSYTEQMLTWPFGAKSIDGFSIYAPSDKLQASTGFRSLSSPSITRDELPSSLQTLYDEALPHYERLLAYSI